MSRRALCYDWTYSSFFDREVLSLLNKSIRLQRRLDHWLLNKNKLLCENVSVLDQMTVAGAMNLPWKVLITFCSDCCHNGKFWSHFVSNVVVIWQLVIVVYAGSRHVFCSATKLGTGDYIASSIFESWIMQTARRSSNFFHLYLLNRTILNR